MEGSIDCAQVIKCVIKALSFSPFAESDGQYGKSKKIWTDFTQRSSNNLSSMLNIDIRWQTNQNFLHQDVHNRIWKVTQIKHHMPYKDGESWNSDIQIWIWVYLWNNVYCVTHILSCFIMNKFTKQIFMETNKQMICCTIQKYVLLV